MPPRTIQYSFSHGECSPEFLGGRVDINRYYSACRTLENYLPLLTGGVERAPGTRFIAQTKGNSPARLMRFEFSIEQAYMLELGAGYIRFYTAGGRLENPPGTPLEVATPYSAADLFQIQSVQSADVLYLVHPRHAPRKLMRLGALQWQLQVIRFHPPPALEEDYPPPATLTPSGTSGTITLTTSPATFLEADIERQVRSGTALAVITSLGSGTPAATAQADVLDPFASTAPIPAGEWFLVGSPVADCTPSRLGPVGSRVVLTLSDTETERPNLLPPGAWTDHSGPVIVSGTATGGAAAASGTQATLIDTSQNFSTAGVQAGHRVLRTSAPVAEGRADTRSQTTNPFDTIGMNPGLSGGGIFAAGNTYSIRQTGSISGSGGTLTLNPGENGVAWAEKSVPVEAGKVYQFRFTVQQSPITVQVGSTSEGVDLYAETTFLPGEPAHLEFTATGTAAFVQLRNTQSPVLATVSALRLHLISVSGWRASDAGSLVQIYGGTVELRRILDPSRAEGIIWHPLRDPTLPAEDPIPAALAGAWVLAPPAWSAQRGFPRTVSFYQGRLAFAGAPLLGVWLSANGFYENFALGPDDDQAVYLEMNANRMNVIEWLEPLRDLLIGTRGTEHLLRGGERGITPSAAEHLPLPTENGSAPRRPMRMQTVLYQLGRGFRNLYEVQLDQDLNQVTDVRDILLDARHITQSGIRQMAVQTRPIHRLWAVREDGQLLCFTADLVEQVRGWARRTTTGQFTSVETLPIDVPELSEQTEEVWCIVNRANGRCIEVMEPGLTLDSALSYSGSEVTTVSGLDHLEGQTVGVLNDGAAETHVVDGGALTLDRPGSQVTVGLQYTPILGLPRLELPLRDGTLQFLRKRILKAWVRLEDSMGLQVNGQTVPFRQTGDLMDVAPPLRDVDVSALLRGWSREGEITLTQPLPFASTILTVMAEVEFEEMG